MKAAPASTIASRITPVLPLRYTYGRRDLFEPFAENQTELPGFGDFVFDRGHNALLSYQQNFGPRTINSVTAGFDRAVRQVFAQNYTVNVNQQWGVSYLPTVPRDFGYPGISVTGYLTRRRRGIPSHRSRR